MLTGMNITCGRCQAEGRQNVIDADPAEDSAAHHVDGLCLEHAFIVLGEMSRAVRESGCTRRQSRPRRSRATCRGSERPQAV